MLHGITAEAVAEQAREIVQSVGFGSCEWAISNEWRDRKRFSAALVEVGVPKFLEDGLDKFATNLADVMQGDCYAVVLPTLFNQKIFVSGSDLVDASDIVPNQVLVFRIGNTAESIVGFYSDTISGFDTLLISASENWTILDLPTSLYWVAAGNDCWLENLLGTDLDSTRSGWRSFASSYEFDQNDDFGLVASTKYYYGE